MEQIINLTCGFKPALRVIEPTVGTIQVWIEGTPDERALIMGKEAKNLQAFTRLAHIFARRHKVFIYLYVKPKSVVQIELDKNLEEAVKLGTFL
jgi:hypothetical protein